MKKLLARPVTEKIYAEVAQRVQKFLKNFSRKPKLTVVLIGNNPASLIYTQKKAEMAIQLGMDHETIHFHESVSVAEVKNCLERLNLDPLVDAILIQRPLPPSFLEKEVLLWLNPEKDADGLHPLNAGKLALGIPGLYPCTPSGIMTLLEYYQIPIEGKTACIVGRSPIVGKPMAMLLLQAQATVIQCHQKTKKLKEFTKQADLLVVAAGKPHLIRKEHVKEGAVIIDVGIHRYNDKQSHAKLKGDVCFEEIFPFVSAITPVPGGVGPMTIAQLMKNTIQAAETNSTHT